MKPFRALIIPVSDGEPAHPIVIPPGTTLPDLPVFIWGPNDPRPSNPIVIPPDAISPGVPTHPIVLPPEIWGPTDPRPTPPIYQPDRPTGGGDERPDHTLPGDLPHPAHPIVIPEPPPVEDSDKALVLVVTADTGPVWFVIDKNDGLGPDNRPPEAGPKRKK